MQVSAHVRAGATAGSAGLAAYRRHRRRARRTCRAVVNATLLALVVALIWFVTQVAFQFYRVPTGSMEPTLVVGDRILVQKLGVNAARLRVGQIVVFKRPPADHVDTNIADVVKRVVATPGETVSSADGHLLVDGKAVPEAYLPKGSVTASVSTQLVPAGDYFVMGDNRTDSYDSRFFGPVPSSLIVGRVQAQVWPPQKFTIF